MEQIGGPPPAPDLSDRSPASCCFVSGAPLELGKQLQVLVEAKHGVPGLRSMLTNYLIRNN